MSQLDLSIAAEVSMRHISFLETGRAAPSREMVLRLTAALGLGLRETNALLEAAGLPRAYAEMVRDHEWPAQVEHVLARMLKQQEPYPMLVLNARYDILRANQAALSLFSQFVADSSAVGARPNLCHALFNPNLMRPFIENWEQLAPVVLAQLQREGLSRGSDTSISELVRELCNYPEVPESWRRHALELPPAPILEVSLARNSRRLRFVTTLSSFNVVLDVGLEDLKLESYFPADEATEAVCRKTAAR